MVDDGRAGQCSPGGRGVGEIGLDDVYLSGQRCWTMSGDGPNGQSSPDKLFNDRSADRAEPGDDVQFRLAHGCHWGILGPGLVG